MTAEGSNGRYILDWLVIMNCGMSIRRMRQSRMGDCMLLIFSFLSGKSIWVRRKIVTFRERGLIKAILVSEYKRRVKLSILVGLAGCIWGGRKWDISCATGICVAREWATNLEEQPYVSRRAEKLKNLEPYTSANRNRTYLKPYFPPTTAAMNHRGCERPTEKKA